MSTKKYKIITVESFYFTFLYFAPNYGSIYQSIDKWCERVGETWSGTTGGCCLGLRSCVAACLLIGPLGPRWGGLGVCGAQSSWWPLTPPPPPVQPEIWGRERKTEERRVSEQQPVRTVARWKPSGSVYRRTGSQSRLPARLFCHIFEYFFISCKDRLIV